MSHTLNPYIDFRYGDYYASDFHLLRVSNSKRYNNVLIPTLTDKTAEVPGGDGMYWFNTYYKQRVFTVDFAFDSLTESDLRDVRRWLNGKQVKELCFDERDDIVYMAKVTGSPTFKFLPFDERIEKFWSNNTTKTAPEVSDGTIVIYKGEGSVQFTCYYPYGRSVNPTSQIYSTSGGGSYTPSTVGVIGELPTSFKVMASGGVVANDWISVTDGQNTYTITFPEAISLSNDSIEWDSSTGLVKIVSTGRAVKFKGNSMGTILNNSTPVITSNISGSVTLTFSFYNRYY